MNFKWTSRALSDLARLYEFLVPVVKRAAARAIQMLTNPRIGERLDESAPREVRRILVGHYEMRYEIQLSTIIYCGFGIPARKDNNPSEKTSMKPQPTRLGISFCH